jgi:uncharacterized membrane protein
MKKADAHSYRQARGRDDGLRVLNLCFFIAIALAAIVIVSAYASTEKWTLPSGIETSSSLEGLKVQGQMLYEGISSKASEFVEWAIDLLTSFGL